MKKFRYEDMKKGWFIGDFEPSVVRTKDFEVAFVKHKKDEYWEKHLHKVATEITLVIKGRIKINDAVFSSGDIFVIFPNEIADPTFLEDSEVVIVKIPSDINDKYIVN